MARQITLENLNKTYQSGGSAHVAVDDLSVTIPEGSFTTIVGPSGCGKTTTLRMIAGLESPTSGRIRFGGEDVTEQRPQERNCGMVFQSIALYPHMTVRENLEYGLKIDGVAPETRAKRIEEAAETLQITEQLDKQPSELSGGQQQRVALGSSFVLDPEVLLLDEPMSDLDAKLKSELRVEVQRIHQELDATVVYVTHDQTEAMTMSDQVLLLNNGQVAQFAPPGDLFDRPVSEYVARFIGTPSTNVVTAEVTSVGDHLLIEGPGFKISVEGNTLDDYTGQTIRVGIRPQYLTPTTGRYSLPVTAEVIEQLGTEFVIHGVTQSDKPVDIVSDKVGDIASGDTFTASFDPKDLFLFDDSGTTICYGDGLALAV